MKVDFTPTEETLRRNENINAVYGDWLKKMGVLQLEERETHISFTPLDDVCHVFSDDPIVCRRIIKAGYEPIGNEADSIGMSFVTPFAFVPKGVIRGRKK